jgi:hypothetical protein
MLPRYDIPRWDRPVMIWRRFFSRSSCSLTLVNLIILPRLESCRGRTQILPMVGRRGRPLESRRLINARCIYAVEQIP